MRDGTVPEKNQKRGLIGSERPYRLAQGKDQTIERAN